MHSVLKKTIILAAAVLATSATLAQTTYPDRPVKFVVPYPPGGVSDALTRHVGHVLEESLGKPFVVENKGGAGSNIGSDYVAHSTPNGYTILLGSTANSVNMSLYPKMTYDTTRDFIPVSLLAEVPNVLVVTSSLPVKTVKELIEYAKKNPTEMNYASSGPGSPAHLSAVKFLNMAGLKMNHIPYKGAGPAIVDVMAGRVKMMLTNIQAVIPGIESGKLKLIATGGATRWPSFPNVPTIAESGVPGYEAGAWYGIMVPKGTPQNVIDRLQQGLAAVKKEASLEAIRKMGAEPVVSSPDVLKARIEKEIASYAQLIKADGITIQ